MTHPLLHPWLVVANDFQLASIHKKKKRPRGHSGFKTLRNTAHTDEGDLPVSRRVSH